MATVLFIWEMGTGIGHLVRLLPLAHALTARGHTVYAALRDLAYAGTLFGTETVRWLQAPCLTRRPTTVYEKPATFSQMLYNAGFINDAGLTATAAAWRTLYDFVRPDVLIFDHSPTALLAARGWQAKRVVMGTGFTCPPDLYPLPNLRVWEPLQIAQLQQEEDQLVYRLNYVCAKWGAPPLERLEIGESE